jgi:exodeoxyribonuclease-1
VLQYNRAPAVAPIGVLGQERGWEKIGLKQSQVEAHMKLLLAHPEFAEILREIFENKPEFKKLPDPEAQLYDGFLNDRDRLRAEAVRNADEKALADFHPEFQDERLPGLLLHYKARSFPKALSEDEQQTWEVWRTARLQAQLVPFMKDLQRLAKQKKDDFLLQELQLWAESIIPSEY